MGISFEMIDEINHLIHDHDVAPTPRTDRGGRAAPTSCEESLLRRASQRRVVVAGA